jgi:hypothetical protein
MSPLRQPSRKLFIFSAYAEIFETSCVIADDKSSDILFDADSESKLLDVPSSLRGKSGEKTVIMLSG